MKPEDLGVLAATFSIAIPFAIWAAAMRTWRPWSRATYALRCAIWPAVFTSFILGGPLARAIAGMRSRYLSDLPDTFAGFLGICVLLCPIALGVGYAVCGSRFQTAGRAPAAKVSPAPQPHNEYDDAAW